MIQNVFHNYTVSVIKETKTLAEFVSRIMNEKNLTARDVESKSGFNITHSYVNKIKNGDAKNPSSPKLQALAKGLDQPEEIIFAIVRGKKADSEKISNERFADIAKGYAALSPGERESLEPFIAAVELAIRRKTGSKSGTREQEKREENKNYSDNIPEKSLREVKKMHEQKKKGKK